MSNLRYALVSPIRDEETNLRRLAESLREQIALPSAWVLVDNGSTDGTVQLAAELTAQYEWVTMLEVEGDPHAQPGAPIVRAFHAGLDHVPPETDVIVKLDADVSMAPDYFERLLQAFDEDPLLGIASGVCLELRGDDWRPTHVTGDHVRGATRAYRRACLDQLLPLEERMGWDGLDELQANVLGWSTRIVPDTSFYHHRPLGARDRGRGGRWRALGESAHYMGYRPTYLTLRALHHARRDPKALAMLWSYAAAAIRRKPVYGDLRVRTHLRQQQRLRNLRTRAREARGRR